MTAFEPGSIVLVHFPFTDLSATKKRPALVVSPTAFSRPHGDIVVLALTSRPQADTTLELENWKAAGLPKATWFKPVIGTLSKQVVVRYLGRLASQDQFRAARLVQTMIAGVYLH